MSMRLPMKPSQLPARTAILPSLFASAMTVATVSGEVCRPRTFSSSLMTFAGLKKWVPTTFSGREVLAAMASISRVEVLVARIACGAAADHGGTVDGERGHLGPEAWNPAGLALREEQVHQRLALRAVAALDERLALARERGFHRPRAGRFDAVDDPERRELSARLRLELAAKGGE